MGGTDVLLVGSGGREHALAWGLRQSSQLGRLYLAPGSAGMIGLGEPCPAPASDFEALAQFCVAAKVGLAVVGPEQPLAEGLGDVLRSRGVAVFGPGKAGAQLEASKTFAKEFMLRHGVATARAQSFDAKGPALDFALSLGLPVVVKADGLAAGKGVAVCESAAQLEAALAACFDEKAFGAAGSRVLIEEFMAGEEASLLCLCDGSSLVPLASAQDHKRVGDGDTGPNTGGMGAYSPAPVLDAGLMEAVWERILDPTLKGLKAEGLDFRGCLYVGLMATAQGPKVVEYNARFGDPETQVVVPRMAFDLLQALLATAQGALAGLGPLKWKDEAAACVVLASRGYPASAEKGVAIRGLGPDGGVARCLVFHSGTARPGHWTTNGGRVLGVTGLGAGLKEALEAAYAGAAKISFEGMHYRRDIGRRALDRPL